MYAKTSTDKKKAGWQSFTTTNGIINNLLEATKYYVTVLTVNNTIPFVELESLPTTIKTITTANTTILTSTSSTALQSPLLLNQ